MNEGKKQAPESAKISDPEECFDDRDYHGSHLGVFSSKIGELSGVFREGQEQLI